MPWARPANSTAISMIVHICVQLRFNTLTGSMVLGYLNAGRGKKRRKLGKVGGEVICRRRCKTGLATTFGRREENKNRTENSQGRESEKTFFVFFPKSRKKSHCKGDFQG
jgi:hypothetical protein